MSKTDIYGAVQSDFGAAEREIGGALGSEDLQVAGAKKQLKGAVTKGTAKVRDVVQTAAERVGDNAAVAVDRGRDVLDRASAGVQQMKDRVDPFVTERPYAALGVGVVVGTVIGLLLAGRRPKVIYVKTER